MYVYLCVRVWRPCVCVYGYPKRPKDSELEFTLPYRTGNWTWVLKCIRPYVLDGLTFWGCCNESSQMSWLTKNTNASCHRLSTGQMSDTSVPAIKSWVSKATVLWWYWERESFLAFCTLWTPPAFLGFSFFCSSICLSASPYRCSSTSSQIVGEGSLFEWLWISWTLLQDFSF